MGSESSIGNSLGSGAPIYVYEIDSEDRIVNCNGGWDEFALANGGHELVSDKIRGTFIWDHISDHPTAGLYRKIFQSARDGRPVQFFLRCDSPTVRRLLHISISPTIDGRVRTTSLVFREDSRDEPYELKRCENRPAEEKHECLVMCTWCAKIDLAGWSEAEHVFERLRGSGGKIPPAVSNGMCSTCAQRIERQLVLSI